MEQLEEENNRLITHVDSLIRSGSKQIETRLKNLEDMRDSKVERLNPVIIPHPSVHNERNQKAIQLHQQGFSVADIARILNCGVGEAELIVNLHGRSEQQ